MERLRADLTRFLDRVFIERELFLRANDKVRYVRLSTRLQKGVVCGLFLITGWLVYSSVGLVLQDNWIADRNATIERQKLAYLELLTEVGEYHEQFARLTQNLEANQGYLLSLLENGEITDSDGLAVLDHLADSQTERAQLALTRDGLRNKLEAFEGELGAIADRNQTLRAKVSQLRSRLSSFQLAELDIQQARERLGARLREMETSLATATRRGERLRDELDVANDELERSREARAQLESGNARLQRRISALDQQLAAAQDEGGRLNGRVAELRQVLGDTDKRRNALERERAKLLAQAAELDQQVEQADLREERLGARISSLEDSLAEASARGETLERARSELQERITEFQQQVADAAEVRGDLERRIAVLDGQLTESREQTARLNQEREQRQAHVASLEEQLDGAAGEQAALEQRIGELEVSLAESEERGERTARERNFYEARVTGLEKQLDDMREIQEGIVKRLTSQTLSSLDAMEKTVAMTGMDVNSLLSSVATSDSRDGQGGPFVPGDFISETDPTYALQASVALLDLQMDRWEALQKVVRQLPLVAPLDTYRVTSGYGARVDPINGRKARHFGIDFTAPLRSPVLATAPGKVVFAGWRGGFGRMVEIDHGLGIRTRYAHLKKILVKPGQEIGHREEIGLLGSSGRSTGPHVHYEIRVNNKPVDPSNFLEAGRYVFKG